MSKNLTQQLLNQVEMGLIDKDSLLSSCLKKLESIDHEQFKAFALQEGYITLDSDEDLDEDLHHLDTTQRIIEKVLRRYERY